MIERIPSLWRILTGSEHMDFIQHEGKLYIPIDVAASIVRKFRLKLIRLGLLQHQEKGWKGQGVAELFDILARQIETLEKFREKFAAAQNEGTEPCSTVTVRCEYCNTKRFITPSHIGRREWCGHCGCYTPNKEVAAQV